jgi:thiol-disulfide isomerase/thioredoxin
MVFVAATIGLAVAVAFNLLLTFGLIARLREMAPAAPAWAPSRLVGRAIGAFEVTATDGTVLTDKLVAARSTIVGFFATGCPACAALRAKLSGARLPAPFIAFVDAEPSDPAAIELSDELARLGPVAYTSRGAAVVEAFGPAGYPTLYRVDRGTVVAASHRLADVLT